MLKRNLWFEGIAINLAEANGWEIVSSERQLNNGTIMFKIPGRNKQLYGWYANGRLRSIKEPAKDSYMAQHGYKCITPVHKGRITFYDAMRYLNKRFGKKGITTCK